MARMTAVVPAIGTPPAMAPMTAMFTVAIPAAAPIAAMVNLLGAAGDLVFNASHAGNGRSSLSRKAEESSGSNGYRKQVLFHLHTL